MDTPRLGLLGAKLGVTSFVSSSHPAESCGLNGLPLTPHSISILGAAQILLTCNHTNLARYLDIQRGKHQRIVVVGESWPNNLRNMDQREITEDRLLAISQQILMASAYLNQMNIVNMNISRDNVMLTEEGEVKLFNYGLGRMTNYGAWVAFPVGDPRLTAPEVFRQGSRVEQAPTITDYNGDVSITTIPAEVGPPYFPNCDSWSLGLLLASITLDIPVLWPKAKVSQVVRKVLSLGECDSGAGVLERISREHGCVGRVSTIPQTVLDLIHTCLSPCDDRPTPDQLLQSDLFPSPNPAEYRYTPPVFPTLSLRCATLPWPIPPPPTHPLDHFTVPELYYLWQLAGGDAMAELRKHGLMVTTPPILSIPSLCTTEGQVCGQPKQRHTLYDKTIISLPISQLQASLDLVPQDTLTPLIDTEEQLDKESRALPLVIRERDVRYQSSRVILYRKLLQAYPHRKKKIWSESLTDVVPQYRPHIWAALLNIPSNSGSLYAGIDKESWTPVDRQIEVDIPRCHQYNELLASPEGHRKLKRVLKAWVADNPHLVYWQGLDSLAAPFLFLNFNNESLAWACLSAFIPKYLHNMFLKDNAAVIQEYLAKFSHLQAFHDPVLFNHLDEIGFIPDLYAIPWVLTMFSHVFPLHKIFHLWDRLLLGNSSFPLCVGLAVLKQLRAQLMEAQFNECILLFSDMPAVDIDNVVSTSMDIFTSTPPTLTWREHDCVRREMPGPLDLSSLPVSVLKEEKVGRISGADLLSLANNNTKKVLCVDVRTVEEFKLGTLQDAVNIPSDGAFNESGELVSSKEELEMARRKGKVIAVMGSVKDRMDLMLAERLLKLDFPRVVTVHGGIEVFRGSGVLVVPNA